jgi:hypothetical protein
MHSDILIVGGGGGGDALASLIAARTLSIPREEAVFATVIWERTLFDPQPGPRAPEDFQRLKPVGKHNYLVHAQSSLPHPALTFTPRLAATYEVDYHLLDITRGAKKVQHQVQELQEIYGFEKIIVVDVGGDILARGDEPGLKSPLADGMALAGMQGAEAEIQVAVTGFGLDGELSQSALKKARVDLSHAENSSVPTHIDNATASDFVDVFEWFPSESSGLTCVSALGYEGVAEIRDQGLRVTLSQRSHALDLYDYEAVLHRNRVANAFVETSSIKEGESILDDFGLTSEIEFERRKAQRLKKALEDKPAEENHESLENDLLAYSKRVSAKGVRYITMRRMAEVLHLPHSERMDFLSYLEPRYPERLIPPVWICPNK